MELRSGLKNINAKHTKTRTEHQKSLIAQSAIKNCKIDESIQGVPMAIMMVLLGYCGNVDINLQLRVVC